MYCATSGISTEQELSQRCWINCAVVVVIHNGEGGGRDREVKDVETKSSIIHSKEKWRDHVYVTYFDLQILYPHAG